MSTIHAILQPAADGTLHLPIPDELRQGKVEVVATLTAVPAVNNDQHLKGFGALKGKIWMAPDFDAPLDDFKEYME